MTGGELEATGTPRTDEVAGERETRFAHASEAEMARILDFYQVRWEYEPTTFPILWNLDGEVVESFAPDFYLPDLEMFLEMTTLKQRLVRKKNRKLRRLRELYPDIRIKLFYARDFRAMMLKYGRLGLAESLSGTTGQVVPVRATVSSTQVEQAPAASAPATVAEAASVEVMAAPISATAVPTPVAPAIGRAGRDRTRTGRRRRRAEQANQAAQAGAEQEGGG